MNGYATVIPSPKQGSIGFESAKLNLRRPLGNLSRLAGGPYGLLQLPSPQAPIRRVKDLRGSEPLSRARVPTRNRTSWSPGAGEVRWSGGAARRRSEV